MGVDPVLAILVVHGTLPSPVRLHVIEIVAAAGIEAAQIDQVHLAAAGRTHPLGNGLVQSAQHHVHDPLVSQDVGVADRGGKIRLQDGPFGRVHVDRPIGAGRGGQFGIDHCLAGEINGRAGGAQPRVQRTCYLRAGTGKIGRQFVVFNGNGDGDLDRFVGHPVIVQIIFKRIDPVGNLTDPGPHAAFGMVQHRMHIARKLSGIFAAKKVGHTLFGDFCRRVLGQQIATDLGLGADVLIDEAQQDFVDPPVPDNRRGGDLQAFLIDFRDAKRHAAG